MLHLIQALSLRLMRDSEEGQTFVEYALVIGGISIFLLLAFAGLSGALGQVVTDITNAL